MNYKSETTKTYDTFPDEFEEKFKSYLQDYLRTEVDEFLKHLPPKGKILDVGSGAGNQALYFKNLGYEVVCIDLSKEMIRKCIEKGLNAFLMDFEEINLPERSFDGVWSYTSLLHSPKSKMQEILKQILIVLKPNGVFFLGMKQGVGADFKVQEKYPGTKRYFSHYLDDELKELLTPMFNLIFSSKTKLRETNVYLNYVLTKK